MCCPDNSPAMPYQEKRFSELLVSDISEKIVLKASQVPQDAKIRDVIERMIANPLSRKVYVVDGGGKYLGTVNTETILRLLGYRVGVRSEGGLSLIRFLRDAFKEDVSRIMVKGQTVKLTSKLTDALEIMLREHLNDLPVVDEEGRLVGELVSLELFLEGRTLFEGEPPEPLSPR